MKPLQVRRRSNDGKGAVPPHADESIAYHLRDTYRALARVFQVETERFGVDMGVWMFLRSLWQEDGLTQKELTERAGLMQPSTSAALTQMERRGLVRQTVDTEDRRKVRIFLTPKSRALLEKLIPTAARVRRQAVSDFSKREVALLLEMLRRIRVNLLAADSNAVQKLRTSRANGSRGSSVRRSI